MATQPAPRCEALETSSEACGVEQLLEALGPHGGVVGVAPGFAPVRGLPIAGDDDDDDDDDEDDFFDDDEDEAWEDEDYEEEELDDEEWEDDEDFEDDEDDEL
ncbi:MAG: hypothetical protein ACTS3F_02865 [Phycisphaerales bacterium]